MSLSTGMGGFKNLKSSVESSVALEKVFFRFPYYCFCLFVIIRNAEDNKSGILMRDYGNRRVSASTHALKK